MKNNTRSSSNIERLEEAVTAQAQQQQHLSTNQTALNFKLDDILAKLSSLEATSSNSTDSNGSRHTKGSLESKHHMKLDVPRFDGTYAMDWIFKISKFFD